MYYLVFLILLSCTPITPESLKAGDCVLGEDMIVWKLAKIEEKSYIFVDVPTIEGAAVHPVDDISTFKKVNCPENI